jgi:hypothetical protein
MQSPKGAKDHLCQNLSSPQPGFNRFSQICREAHRRGKPELLLRAVERLAGAIFDVFLKHRLRDFRHLLPARRLTQVDIEIFEADHHRIVRL